MPATFRPAIAPVSRRTAPQSLRAEAETLLGAWNHGVAAATTVARASDLASFGAFAWRTRDAIGVIRRVIELARENPRALRPLAVRWNEAQRERGLARRTLARQWTTLVSLLAVLDARGLARATVGGLPRTLVAIRTASEASALVDALALAGRHRDAAIVGLLAEVGLEHRELTALRVRDARALDCSPALASALARVCDGQAPQAPALRGPQGTALSSTAIYHVCEGLGTSLTVLRELAAKGAA